MAPILYYYSWSPPVRAVLITAKAIGLELELREINLVNGDHMKPEYIKINPQHSVPTLDDDGFIIWDSHAIMTYLVSKYAKDDSLYPKDLKTRAIIDQRLHFDSGMMFPRARPIIMDILQKGAKTVDEEKKELLFQSLQLLEAFLGDNEWLAGETVTLADICIVSGISSVHETFGYVDEQFPKLSAWYKRCQELPYYDANLPGLHIFVGSVKQKLNS